MMPDVTRSKSRERSFRGLFWTLALLGLLLDQGSKYGVFRWLSHDGPGETRYVLIQGAFEMLTQYTVQRQPDDTLTPLRSWSSGYVPRVNHGALFGLGGEYIHLANLLFAAVSIVAAVAIVIWSFQRGTTLDLLLSCALGLILAGTLGNLYDRLVFHGVRDFLHWFGGFEWPVFNIADSCLVCGASLLLLQAFWMSPKPEETKPEEASAALPRVESSV